MESLPAVLYGSVMYLLVHYVMQGTPAENLTKLWIAIKRAYDALGTKNRYSSMKLTMLSTKGGIKLRGTAAEVRAIGAALHVVWQQFGNLRLELHRKIELCLRLSVRMEDILDKHPEEFVLPGVRVSPQK